MEQKKQRIELEVKSSVMMTTAIVVSIVAVLGGAFFMMMGIMSKKNIQATQLTSKDFRIDSTWFYFNKEYRLTEDLVNNYINAGFFDKKSTSAEIILNENVDFFVDKNDRLVIKGLMDTTDRLSPTPFPKRDSVVTETSASCSCSGGCINFCSPLSVGRIHTCIGSCNSPGLSGCGNCILTLITTTAAAGM